MRIKHALAISLGVLPMLFCAPAWSDGIAVTITNDGTEAVLVTVYDVTSGHRSLILSQRVNGFATIPLNAPQDSNGRANLAWTAVTVDANDRKCGHADRMGLADSASVTVHADSECGAGQPAATRTSFEDQ